MTGVSGTWRLQRRPALDGIRAIAVALVVATHFDANQLTGGGVFGVKVFFTLSGFLITALLLEEYADRGWIRLREFYVRRALRLTPALVALLVVMGVLVQLGWPIRGGIFAASALYVSNWYLLATADADGIHWTALGHTWSLSIEEQFYVMWPLLLIGAARWRGASGVAWVAAVGAVLSLVDVAVTGRSALATDVSAWCLLAGCLLAAVMHQTRAQRPSVWWLAPLVAAAPFGLIWGGGLAGHVVAPAVTVAAIWVAAQRDIRWLQVRPIQWVGRRSYGLYLWHAPVGVFLTNVELSAWTRAGIGIPVSLLLTALSWRYVEQPFLRLKDRRSRAVGRSSAAASVAGSSV